MTKPATDFQKEVASKLGVPIDPSSFIIAATQLSEFLAPAFYSEAEYKPATEKQVSYAASLGVDVSKDTRRVASARIQEKHDERSHALIQSMGLAPGVQVLWKERERLMVISSIAQNGRLWFRGGNGMGAFPHQVELPPAQPTVQRDGPASGGSAR
ncbi:MAG: hypothetical protein ACU84H_17595 [Gammaproteobacteria bacterium]